MAEIGSGGSPSQHSDKDSGDDKALSTPPAAQPSREHAVKKDLSPIQVNLSSSGSGPVPSPSALAYMSPTQPQSPDPVHDLPADLLQQGWRKFWSRRENRPYLFNKITNESRWEMPGILGVCAVLITVVVHTCFAMNFIASTH